MKPDISSWRRDSWANQWKIYQYNDDEDTFFRPDSERAIQTSLLSVCRLVKAEAIEVLYDTKLLRGWPIDLDVVLESYDVYSRVRHVEITGLLDCTTSRNSYDHANHSRHLRDFLERLQRLPRVRSILILSDCLTAEPRATIDTWVSVMEFVQDAGLGPATCVDVGRYQLHGKFKNIQIVNSKLIKMWQAVRDTPEDYDGVQDALAIIDGLQSSIDVPNVPTWASHTSLRCWVDIQQQFLALRVSGEWDLLKEKASTGVFRNENEHTDDEFKFDFFRRAAYAAVRTSMSAFPLLRTGQHVLKRLQPNDNSDVLNEVSQFVAVNIVLYNHYAPSANDRWTLRPIKWTTEGEDFEKTSLEYMAEQQSIALSGGASKEFVLDPSIQRNVPACRLIERRLFIDWIEKFDHRDWTDRIPSCRATPSQTGQLTHLHLAVLQPYTRNRDDQRGRDEWSRRLMVRYSMAYGRLEQDEVERTSVNDLRTIMSVILNVFDHGTYGPGCDWLQSLRCDKAVPSTFDSDVYPGLGWKYGELLAQAFKRYTSQGQVSKALASQWAKESIMWN